MYERIPEQVVQGKRLGRHIRHDPRSLRYQVQAGGAVISKTWTRYTPVLDQGEVGSCTGNATVGALGSGPLYDILRKLLPTQALDENEALKVYSLATTLDTAQGTYPPTDTGSDGLSACKAAQQLGLISGYQHITSLSAAKTAIVSGPFITGVDWYSSMDNPDSRGLVTVGGSVRGGHEFEVLGYDATNDIWEFVNSWGTSWGKGGHFFMSSADWNKLLVDGGDATTLVPLTSPAPTPTPAPVPGDAINTLFEAQKFWCQAKHTGSNKTAAQASYAYFKTMGLM